MNGKFIPSPGSLSLSMAPPPTPPAQPKPKSNAFAQMKPRNLSTATATPIQFNRKSEERADAGEKQKTGHPQNTETRSVAVANVSYMDRAAQRRAGLDPSADFNWKASESSKILDESSVDAEEAQLNLKEKYEFLQQQTFKEFPNCQADHVSRIMERILLGNEDKSRLNPSGLNPNFSTLFLQFKSIEEESKGPFDPHHRPRRVIRLQTGLGSSIKAAATEAAEDLEVILRVKEAMQRLHNAFKDSRKYFSVLKETNDEDENEAEGERDDIFPGVGKFDTKLTFKEDNSKSLKSINSQAKSRLFKPKKEPAPMQPTPDVDIFDLIAGKSNDAMGEDSGTKPDEDAGGGLFGFSDFLPKLNRLQEDKQKLPKQDGIYANILGNEANEEEKDAVFNEGKDEDDYLIDDEDDEDIEDPNDEKSAGKRTSKSLARWEAKKAAKVEKIYKTKFGADLQ